MNDKIRTFEQWLGDFYPTAQPRATVIAMARSAYKQGERSTWLKVFDIIGDLDYANMTELIEQLQASRDNAGYKP